MCLCSRTQHGGGRYRPPPLTPGSEEEARPTNEQNHVQELKKDIQTIMATELNKIRATLQRAILSSSPTKTFSTLMASSSPSLASSSQPVTIQTTNNDIIEKGGTPILKPDSETGYHQNVAAHGMNYYRVTLMISSEQETAIINLFREKQWMYVKLECDRDFTQSCNARSNILVPKDKEIISFNENHAHHSAIDNQFSNDYDSNGTSNRFIQSSISSSMDEKEILEEEDVAESTIDPMHQNVINDNKYISREIGSSNESATEKFTLDSDILSTRTNVSTNAQGFEQERYKDPLANSVKEEIQSDGTNALVKPENKSNFSDILTFDGILDGIRDDMSKSMESNMADIHSIVKVKRQARNKRANIYCNDCEHTFKSRMFYERHLKEDRCKHTCVLCGKVFLHGHTSNYKLHMKFHRKQRDYECYICKQKFIEKAKMELHVERHTNPKPKICEKCGKGFTTTAGLTEHMEHVHIKNRDKFQCSKCAKMYTRKSGLEYHMTVVHESDSNVFFSCDICDKSFKHKNNLRLHQHTHKTKEFKCNKCNASFKQNCHLLFHQRRHEKAYSMFCKTCNKGFYSRGKLVDHENIHTGQKPHQCSICDYRCACKTNLYKHMKIHMGASNT